MPDRASGAWHPPHRSTVLCDGRWGRRRRDSIGNRVPDRASGARHLRQHPWHAAVPTVWRAGWRPATPTCFSPNLRRQRFHFGRRPSQARTRRTPLSRSRFGAAQGGSESAGTSRFFLSSDKRPTKGQARRPSQRPALRQSVSPAGEMPVGAGPSEGARGLPYVGRPGKKAARTPTPVRPPKEEDEAEVQGERPGPPERAGPDRHLPRRTA
ncbi:hypothetical protein BOBR111200_19505 [Bordetella bronchialis]